MFYFLSLCVMIWFCFLVPIYKDFDHHVLQHVTLRCLPFLWPTKKPNPISWSANHETLSLINSWTKGNWSLIIIKGKWEILFCSFLDDGRSAGKCPLPRMRSMSHCHSSLTPSPRFSLYSLCLSLSLSAAWGCSHDQTLHLVYCNDVLWSL